MAADESAPSTESALAVAFAERVRSVVSIFLERLDRPYATDTFDPVQGIELRWRQLNGMTQPPDLQRLLEAQLPLTRERIRSSGRDPSARSCFRVLRSCLGPTFWATSRSVWTSAARLSPIRKPEPGISSGWSDWKVSSGDCPKSFPVACNSELAWHAHWQ